MRKWEYGLAKPHERLLSCVIAVAIVLSCLFVQPTKANATETTNSIKTGAEAVSNTDQVSSNYQHLVLARKSQYADGQTNVVFGEKIAATEDYEISFRFSWQSNMSIYLGYSAETTSDSYIIIKDGYLYVHDSTTGTARQDTAGQLSVGVWSTIKVISSRATGKYTVTVTPDGGTAFTVTGDLVGNELSRIFFSGHTNNTTLGYLDDVKVVKKTTEGITTILDQDFENTELFNAAEVLTAKKELNVGGTGGKWTVDLRNNSTHQWIYSTAPIDDDEENEENTLAGSGTCGENLTWMLDTDGLLTISGTGAMTDYGEGASPWYSRFGHTLKKVVIETGVTSIGDSVFFDCPNLIEIIIPDSITSIGGSAFEGCTGLTHITIPDAVTSIGSCAFYNCTGLVTVNFNAVNCNSTGPIGISIFVGCTNLRTITIGENVTAVPCYMFSSCTGLTSVTIPDSVTSIGDGALRCCPGLTSITIPGSVTHIGNSAFYECYGLTTVVYCGTQEQWDAISIEAYNTPLTEATLQFHGFENGVCSYCGYTEGWEYSIADGEVTITGYSGDDTDLTIPATIEGLPVTNIGDDAFHYNTVLTSIAIPDSVIGIGNYAFCGCTSLTSITIPDSVIGIGAYTFSDCTGLTSITIPDKVTSIGVGAFSGCTGLTGIWVDENNPDYSSDSYGVLFNKDKTLLIQAPGAPSVITSFAIPDGVIGVGYRAFSGCTSLTSITIPDSVTSIGAWAFCGCISLTSVDIGNSVTSIGQEAFIGCTGLISVTIPTSVTSIGWYAFSGCTSLTQVTIPASVTSLGGAVFEFCESLTGIWVDQNNPNYSSDSFGVLFNKDKSQLIQAPGTIMSYTIPSGVTVVGWGAFCGCSNLAQVAIPDSVTSIGDYAFYDCSALNSIIIPDSVTSIGEGVFYYCTGLERVVYCGTQEQWETISVGESNTPLTEATLQFHGFENGVCSYCGYTEGWKYSIADGEVTITGYSGDDTELTIPATIEGLPVTSIGWEAFRDCTSLTSITIPDSVTSIGKFAFRGCTSLTSVTFGENSQLTSIGWEAFRDCTSLTSITIPDSVIGIGDSAFRGCTSLTSVTFGENSQLTSTGGWAAFKDCTSLTSITIPDSVTSISSWAFCGCTSLTSVDIGNSVTGIGQEAFRDCTGLISVTIPDSVTTIAWGAFSGCTSLTQVTIPASVTSLGGAVFEFCESLTGIWVDQNNPNYSSDSFGVLFNKYKSQLIQAPGTIMSYTIPSGVTVVGRGAFCGCSNLAQVAIPDSIINIGEFVFYDCGKLERVVYCGTQEQWETISVGESNTPLTEAMLQFHSYMNGACEYCGDTGVVIASGTCGENLTWTLGTDGLLTISGTGDMTDYNDYGMYAPWHEHRSSILALAIENGVTSIGSGAFSGCTGLTTVIYCGTQEQWDAISIGADNTPLTEATLQFHSFENGICSYCGEVKTYVVVFKDYNGTILSTRTYHWGDTITVPTNPTKAADHTYTYTFAGWDKTIVNCAGNATYTATYTPTFINYTVVFKDYNGAVLSTKTYHWGDTVTAPTNPTKAADNTYTYAFAGWDKAVASCAGNATYTAKYTPAYINYTVAFKNWDGAVLSTKTYHYGEAVSAPTAPTRPSGGGYSYTFTGWDKAVASCTGNTTYIAVYTAKSLVPSKITSSSHTVSGGTISKIGLGTTIGNLLRNLGEAQYARVYKDDQEVAQTALIGTGMVVKIMDGSTVKASVTVVVTGDTNGDGKTTVTDLLAAKAHLLKKSTLQGAYAQAADTNGDKGISITDFIQMKAHILGKSLVQPQSAV